MNTLEITLSITLYIILFTLPCYYLFRFIRDKFFEDIKNHYVFTLFFTTLFLTFLLISIPFFRSSIVLLESINFYQILQNVLINSVVYFVLFALFAILLCIVFKNLLIPLSFKKNYIMLFLIALISVVIIFMFLRPTLNYYNKSLDKKDYKHINL